MPAIVAIGNAIEKLGELLARPPVTPSSWWDRVRDRTPPSPPGVKLYKLMGPGEDLEEFLTRRSWRNSDVLMSAGRKLARKVRRTASYHGNDHAGSFRQQDGAREGRGMARDDQSPGSA